MPHEFWFSQNAKSLACTHVRTRKCLSPVRQVQAMPAWKSAVAWIAIAHCLSIRARARVHVGCRCLWRALRANKPQTTDYCPIATSWVCVCGWCAGLAQLWHIVAHICVGRTTTAQLPSVHTSRPPCTLHTPPLGYAITSACVQNVCTICTRAFKLYFSSWDLLLWHTNWFCNFIFSTIWRGGLLCFNEFASRTWFDPPPPIILQLYNTYNMEIKNNRLECSVLTYTRYIVVHEMK